MKKKLGIIIGVIAAIIAVVLCIVFINPDKNTENTTTQNNEIAQDTDHESKEEEKISVMEEVIDLYSVDLSKYGISAEYDISPPYPTSLGCAYIVRDSVYDDDSNTYLFVTTKDDILFADADIYSTIPLTIDDENVSYNSYEIYRVDIDGENGEEIIIMGNTGGNGGYGVFQTSVWKIADNKLQRINFSEETFEVTLEAKNTVVFKNEDLGYEKKVLYKNDQEGLFDDDGMPEKEYVDKNDPNYMPYDGGFFPPHDVNILPYGNETTKQCIITLTSWSYLSKYDGNDTVLSVVDYVYDKSTNSLVVRDAQIDVEESEENAEFEESETFNRYTYYDINNDGKKELIIREKDMLKTFKVYAFANDKMYFAGEIEDEHGALYGNGKTITAASRNLGEAGKEYSVYETYELVDNKLVLKENGTCAPLNDAANSTYGKKVLFKNEYRK